MCKPTLTTPLHVVALPTEAATKLAASTVPPEEPMKKSVSFHETVDVYVIDRLDAFSVRELFYRHEDYRRFRSDSCLEILQAQANQSREQDTLRAVFRALFGTMGSKRDQWVIPRSTQAPPPLRSRCCTMEVRRVSPETLVRELAFAT